MSSARRSTALTLADAQASRPTSSPLAGKHDVCVKVKPPKPQFRQQQQPAVDTAQMDLFA